MPSILLLLMVELWGVLSCYVYVTLHENQATEHDTGQLDTQNL
jgi:hypothetical protein